MRSLIQIGFILLILFTGFTSCCKCEYTKIEDMKSIRINNHDLTEFTNAKIIYYQDGTITDTLYLTRDTTNHYLSNAFSIKADEPLNFNYDWDLRVTDSLSFYFSKFIVKTSVEKSCCSAAGTHYLESYHLDSEEKNGSVLVID